MLNATAKFKQEWYKGEIQKLCFADITLEDETELAFTNVQIWAGGFSIDNAVSEDESFTALGSAIIGSASIVINNIDEIYSDYDFMNASVILYIGLELPLPDNSDTDVEKIKVGTYHVDNPHYNGSTITLDLLDNMEQFDRPYTTSLSYPATLSEIVHDACTKCGVVFSPTSEHFPNYTYEVDEKPSDKDTTYREIISWVAMIAGCFCKCDVNGRLELKWFDITTLEAWEDSITDGGLFSPWNNPSSIDGGSFNPWNTGAVLDGGSFTDFPSVHYISSLYRQDICIDDTIITGVRILIRTESEDEEDAIKEFVEEQEFSGVNSYIIEIENNPFITVDTAQDVLDYLATQLIGIKFRKLNVSHKSDPTIEIGDIAVVIDRKARQYPTLITHVSFTIGSSQTLVCGSETPARNKSTRFSAEVKNYVATRKDLLKERNSWEYAEEQLAQRIANANGLYATNETTQSGTIHYLHNKPNKDESDILIVFSDVGITMTANALDQTPIWYGFTVDGNLVANLIAAHGIDADWINSGTLSLGGNTNTNGSIKIYKTENGTTTLIGQWDKNGIYALGATISGVLTAGNGSTIGGLHVSDDGMYSRDYSTYDSYSRGASGTPGYRYGFFLGKDGSISAKSSSKSQLRIGQNDFYIGGMNVDGVEVIMKSQSNNDVGYEMSSTNSYDNVRLNFNGLYIRKYPGNYYVDINTSSGTYKFKGDIECESITASGTKPRVVKTEDYSDRLLYCYETPTPMFGDIGEGIIGEDGLCYIIIDPVFAETISKTQYQVFLQRYEDGDIFVKERHGGYFIVQGTPNMSFGWEIKAKQAGYEMRRLDKKIGTSNLSSDDYGSSAQLHIEDINKERMVE